MSSLPGRHIETLIELVEDKLLCLSSDRREHSARYQDLQSCRHSLLGLAAEADAKIVTPPATAWRNKACHLRPILGGKA